MYHSYVQGRSSCCKDSQPWDNGSFLHQFASGTGPIYEQQLPIRKYKCPQPHQRRPDTPVPHFRGKAPSKRPNAASNMTGGRAPQVGDK